MWLLSFRKLNANCCLSQAVDVLTVEVVVVEVVVVLVVEVVLVDVVVVVVVVDVLVVEVEVVVEVVVVVGVVVVVVVVATTSGTLGIVTFAPTLIPLSGLVVIVDRMLNKKWISLFIK